MKILYFLFPADGALPTVCVSTLIGVRLPIYRSKSSDATRAAVWKVWRRSSHFLFDTTWTGSWHNVRVWPRPPILCRRWGNAHPSVLSPHQLSVNQKDFQSGTSCWAFRLCPPRFCCASCVVASVWNRIRCLNFSAFPGGAFESLVEFLETVKLFLLRFVRFLNLQTPQNNTFLSIFSSWTFYRLFSWSLFPTLARRHTRQSETNFKSQTSCLLESVWDWGSRFRSGYTSQTFWTKLVFTQTNSYFHN